MRTLSCRLTEKIDRSDVSNFNPSEVQHLYIGLSKKLSQFERRYPVENPSGKILCFFAVSLGNLHYNLEMLMSNQHVRSGRVSVKQGEIEMDIREAVQANIETVLKIMDAYPHHTYNGILNTHNTKYVLMEIDT